MFTLSALILSSCHPRLRCQSCRHKNEQHHVTWQVWSSNHIRWQFTSTLFHAVQALMFRKHQVSFKCELKYSKKKFLEALPRMFGGLWRDLETVKNWTPFFIEILIEVWAHYSDYRLLDLSVSCDWSSKTVWTKVNNCLRVCRHRISGQYVFW
jgi:hypothetical protein